MIHLRIEVIIDDEAICHGNSFGFHRMILAEVIVGDVLVV
jgi:hypothetical protein